MFDSIAQTLGEIGSVTFWTCIGLLVAIDLLAIAVVVQTRSRDLVNRWTKTIVGANLLLLGTGVGVPATAYLARSVVVALAPSVEGPMTQARESVITPSK